MTPAVDTIAPSAAASSIAAGGLPLIPDETPTRSLTTRMIHARHRRALLDYARTLDTPADPS
ncbi:hypothetical protein B0W47_07330 [Komagataeibacter nataicola]|uniref:Uncharacterized protein n=1 Tax=Komagataeibacter nataicola TaxID=265960 RepID=A0A9N7H0J2_9PROT|nr:hypothetical protein [Komagataeibacter nataicola]AQU87314.1 hypothetical protein B0W47_07330 [Komagataeibacter nataicola]PYD67423.1 hypothetical protein CDI09_02515 [Komagataeibacter nataicola]WEQ55737.1 hypothetical protein LV564_17045 [Komagataeibacter nataicola]WNM09340.1 hypothetical protein RI056_05030 [Komagataeibacter nataicola]